MAASDRYSAAGKATLANRIQGLREAKRAFQALPAVSREAFLAATDLTVREIVREARARLLASPSIRTRNLYTAVTSAVTPTNGRGRVGIGVLRHVAYDITTRKRTRFKGRFVKKGRRLMLARPDQYARFVEFGTKNMRAEPFMVPAAEGQTQPFLDRCRAAGRGIERNTAAIGGRLV